MNKEELKRRVNILETRRLKERDYPKIKPDKTDLDALIRDIQIPEPFYLRKRFDYIQAFVDVEGEAIYACAFHTEPEKGLGKERARFKKWVSGLLEILPVFQRVHEDNKRWKREFLPPRNRDERPAVRI